jgi:hypothetical protein
MYSRPNSLFTTYEMHFLLLSLVRNFSIFCFSDIRITLELVPVLQYSIGSYRNEFLRMEMEMG